MIYDDLRFKAMSIFLNYRNVASSCNMYMSTVGNCEINNSILAAILKVLKDKWLIPEILLVTRFCVRVQSS
jgi:hypothetical protein